MVTCDRHCEPWRLSMAVWLCAFLFRRNGRPALTAASRRRDVSSSGPTLNNRFASLKPWHRAPLARRALYTPRLQTSLLLRCLKVHRDEPLRNGTLYLASALYLGPAQPRGCYTLWVTRFQGRMCGSWWPRADLPAGGTHARCGRTYCQRGTLPVDFLPTRSFNLGVRPVVRCGVHLSLW